MCILFTEMDRTLYVILLLIGECVVLFMVYSLIRFDPVMKSLKA